MHTSLKTSVVESWEAFGQDDDDDDDGDISLKQDM